MARKRVIYQSEALFTTTTGLRDGNGFAFLNPHVDWDTSADAKNKAASNHWSTSETAAGIVGRFWETGVQLHRVTEANYGFEITRTDVNQFGQLAAIDRIILEQPTVTLDFTYYLMSGQNEKIMGFNTEGDASAITEFLKGEGDVRNYYIYVASEGLDAVEAGGGADDGDGILDNTTSSKCIGLGNGTLTNYTVDAAVGDMPTASVTLECFNMRFYNTITGQKPTIKPEDGTNLGGDFILRQPTSGTGFSCLRHGDVDVSISGTQGVVKSDLKLQNFSLSLDLDREPIQKLGTKFNFSREIVFPVTPTVTMDAIMGDIEANNLADMVVGGTDTEFNIHLNLNAPDAGINLAGYAGNVAVADSVGSPLKALRYDLLGAKLDSQTFTSTIGDNKSVALGFSAQIGGSGDAIHNMRIADGGAICRSNPAVCTSWSEDGFGV